MSCLCKIAVFPLITGDHLRLSNVAGHVYPNTIFNAPNEANLLSIKAFFNTEYIGLIWGH